MPDWYLDLARGPVGDVILYIGIFLTFFGFTAWDQDQP